MKIIRNNISESVKLIQSKIDEKTLSVFCGAGISVPSGIPTVIPLIRELLCQLNCSQDDLQSFLKNDDLPIPFESIIQVLKETLLYDGNKPFLPEFVRLFNAKPNSNHHLLAQLLEQKKINNIITTNFDCCIENVFKDRKTNDQKLIVYNKQEDWLKHTEVQDKLIKIHGSTETPVSIGATVDQITKTEFFNKNQIILDKILRSTPVILFLGYSCSDKWDVTRVFKTYKEEEKPEIIFWQHKDGRTKGPTINQEEIFMGYSCTWITGDTNKLIVKLSNQNKIIIPEYNFVPAIYPFKDLKPLHASYVLGKLFMAAHLYKPAIKYLEFFVDYQTSKAINNSIFLLATESLAELYRKFNRYEECQTSFLQAIELASQLKDNSEKEQAFIVARLQRKLAVSFLANGDPTQANKYMVDALNVLKPYLNTRLNIDHKFQLAEIFNDFGYLKQQENDWQEGIKNFKSAVKLRKQLAKIYPQRYLISCSESLSNLGSTYHYNNQYKKAIGKASEAIDIVRDLAEANPTVYLEELSRKLNNLGCMYRDKPNPEMALTNLNEALVIWQQLSKDERDVYYRHVAYTLINLSRVFLKRPKNRTASLNYLDKAIPILVEYQHVAAVNKHFRTVANVLKEWSLDPRKYFNDKWGLIYHDD